MSCSGHLSGEAASIRELLHAMGQLYAISPTPSPALLRGSRGLQVLCVIMPGGTDMNTDSDSSYCEAWGRKILRRSITVLPAPQDSYVRSGFHCPYAFGRYMEPP